MLCIFYLYKNWFQVYKVVYALVPQAADELELRVGDYIYVSKECIENSIDGWVDGTSWLTGNKQIIK